jgi:SAM-dependent methyltransferase
VGSARATAHAASIWYALDQPERGDLAIDWLTGRQSSDGGFREDHRPNPAPGSIWTAIHFLQASQAQVRSAFARNEAQLPRTIEVSDGRYVAVRRWLGDLAEGARVLDAGCGSGRFIARLSSESPRLHLIGVDGSRQALERLPKGVERREGDLLRLPIADGECDAAYMVEALEHALLPRRAIDEMCRTVRPGGRILVIDKCRSSQGLSLYEPWERWFTAEEVHAWLATHCDQVSVAPVAHGRHQQPKGLFLCWTARKRAVTSAIRNAA